LDMCVVGISRGLGYSGPAKRFLVSSRVKEWARRDIAKIEWEQKML
jgi:hypothetical protein